MLNCLFDLVAVRFGCKHSVDVADLPLKPELSQVLMRF